MSGAAEAVLLAAAVPALVASGYLLLLTLLSRELRAPPAPPPSLRFAIVIPAHDEAAGIAATVRSALSVDYPRQLFLVLVVADNCADETAQVARDAGANVLVRTDTERRGKGFALAYAFDQLDACDAVVVIDADTVVSQNLLSAFAARLAAGENAVHAEYVVRNPEASWRTRLVAVALGAFHTVRSRGRERLGVSCGLRGNGMCFSRRLLREVPHQAHSLVEDLEHNVALARAGYRVAFAGEAQVWGEMVAGEQASRSQRLRWEGGRHRLAKAVGPQLLREGLARRSGLLVDASLELLVPPLATVVGYVAAGLVASGALLALTGRAAPLWVFSGCLAAIAAYVLRGWSVSGTGWRGLRDLCLAPAYVLWKWTLRPARAPSGEWVRTARQPGPGASP